MITFWITREAPTKSYTVHRHDGPVEMVPFGYNPETGAYEARCVSINGARYYNATVLDDSYAPPMLVMHDTPLCDLWDLSSGLVPEIFQTKIGTVHRLPDYEVLMTAESSETP